MGVFGCVALVVTFFNPIIEDSEEKLEVPKKKKVLEVSYRALLRYFCFT